MVANNLSFMRIFFGSPDESFSTLNQVLYIERFINRYLFNHFYFLLFLFYPGYFFLVVNHSFFIPSTGLFPCRITMNTDKKIGLRLVGKIRPVPQTLRFIFAVTRDNIGSPGVLYF